MFKKSPSRNQRSKSIKVKHVLQICLLLGVCFWLIYQVKHSHDKRKEFDEKDTKASVKTQSDGVILKFGRKDLPRVEVSKNYKHEEEEEEENGVEEENKHDEEQEETAKIFEEEEQEGAIKHEEDEQEEATKHEEEEQEEASKHEEEEQEEASKHEEEEQEEASKHEEEEQEDEGSKHDDEEQEAEIKDEETDEGRGVGDDEVDENEQERAAGEAEHEEEFIEEEKEREAEGDEKENEEKENEEKEGQDESDNSGNDQNHDGGGRNAHEAREEHYKADDASSAVSHDTQISNSEIDKLVMENSNDNSTVNASVQESRSNTTEETNGENKSDLKVDEGKHSEGGGTSNATYTKENDHETVSSNSENISLPNTTNITDFIDQASSNSTEVSKEPGDRPGEENTETPVLLQNGTAKIDGRVTEERYKEQANETISNSLQSDSNIVDLSKPQNVDSSTRESSDSSINAESGMSEEVTKVNATVGGDSFGSPDIKESTDSTQNEKPEGDNESGGTDESSDTSSSNIALDEGQHDPIDSADNTLPQEEKDARVDLSTLPDIRTEGSNVEDTASE